MVAIDAATSATSIEPPGASGAWRSARGVQWRAFHQAALSLAAPVRPDAEAVAALLRSIVDSAVAALGGCSGSIVLLHQPAWHDLAVASRPDARLLWFEPSAGFHWVVQRHHGATEEVLATGEVLVVPDTLNPEPYGPYDMLVQRGIRARALAPLRAEHVQGVLCVNFLVPGDLSGEEREALELFAAHVTFALERVRLAHAELRRTRQAEQQTAVLAAVGAASELPAVLEALVRGALRLVDGHSGQARLFDAATGICSLQLRVNRDGSLELERDAGRLPAGSNGARILAGASAHLVDDLWALPAGEYPLADLVRERGLRSSINVPIQSGTARLGSLHIDHELPGFFGTADLALVEAQAAQAAGAIERVRLEVARQEAVDALLVATRRLEHANHQLRRLSALDGLTGIANRRALDEFLEREWRRARRRQTFLSLIVVDVDEFKHYNDAFGHLAGDDCLRRIAGVVESFARRPGDLAARFGGEEFILVLAETKAADAEAIAGRLVKAVEDLTVPHAPSASRPLATVSAGVAACRPSHGLAIADLVRAADTALYQAKRDGRNCVRVDPGAFGVCP